MYFSELSIALKTVAHSLTHSHTHSYSVLLTIWEQQTNANSHIPKPIQWTYIPKFSEIIDTINLNAKYKFLHFSSHISMFLCRLLVVQAAFYASMTWQTIAMYISGGTHTHSHWWKKKPTKIHSTDRKLKENNKQKYRINVNLYFVTMPFTRAEGSIYSNCRSALLLNANNTFSTAEFHIQIWILKHSKPFKYRTTIKYVLRNHNFS